MEGQVHSLLGKDLTVASLAPRAAVAIFHMAARAERGRIQTSAASAAS